MVLATLVYQLDDERDLITDAVILCVSGQMLDFFIV